MSNYYRLSVLFFFAGLSYCLTAQSPCELPPAKAVIWANNVAATISNNGTLFEDDRPNAGYAVTLPGTGRTAKTIRSAGLWIAGRDLAGRERVAANPANSPGTLGGFHPGPLNPVTGNPETEVCRLFNRIWTVDRYDIRRHVQDYWDNGVIDNPIHALLAWPGRGNPHFEAYNGFSLPYPMERKAPFFDVNFDGIYNPFDGDFPAPPNLKYSDPATLSWCMFHSYEQLNGGGTGVFPIEIGQTIWSYHCSDNDFFGNTIFVDYSIRSLEYEDFTNVYVGMMTEFSLGCPSDDYFGSKPEYGVYYAYNADPYDGDSLNGCEVFSFDEYLPVASVNFVNREMNTCIGYGTTNQGLFPTQFVHAPTNEWEYLRLLSGRWRDGTPLSFGGTGYQTGPPTVNHIFPDDPNLSEGWSMFAENLPAGRFNVLGSSEIGQLPPNEYISFTLAFSFHHNDSLNSWLGQFEGIESDLHQFIEWNVWTASYPCATSNFCTTDCVWPGDANADGTADHRDLTALAIGRHNGGPERHSPRNWGPYHADNWPQVIFGDLNLKHADCDGNGMVDMEDFFVTEINYGKQVPGYVPVFEYPQGSELLILPNPGFDLENVQPGSEGIVGIALDAPAPVHTLAFTVEYNPLFFKPIAPEDLGNAASATHFFRHTGPGHIDVAWAAEWAQGVMTNPGPLLSLPLRAYSLDEFPGELPSLSTVLRIRNPVAFDPDGQSVAIGAMQRNILFTDGPLTAVSESSRLLARLFPNPAHDELTVLLSGAERRSFTLCDLAGRVMSAPLFHDGDQVRIPVAGLRSGLYLLRIVGEKESAVLRWCKL